MAKPVTQKIKLLSTAGTGFFYVTKKNPRTSTEKLSFKKYDPVARKHVEFKETKIKYDSEPATSPDLMTKPMPKRALATAWCLIDLHDCWGGHHQRSGRSSVPVSQEMRRT